jgi:hypothetical protein
LRAFLSVGVEASTQTLLQKGRPFILRRLIGMRLFAFREDLA